MVIGRNILAEGRLGGDKVNGQPRVGRPGFAGNSDIFFAAVALTRMPMLVTDPNLSDNPIAFANQAFCELTGYAPAELVGRNCRFLQGPGTDRGTVGRIRAALARRTEIAVEILNYRRDGTAFWNALFISPVFAPDGRLLYYFASLLDVSRRRLAERALEEAQRLDGLGALAGGIAHEFNNLLTIVLGNVEPLLRAPPDERAGARLRRVRVAADRASALTRAMVAFARRQRLENEVLDLRALVGAMLPGVREMLAPTRRVLIDLPDGPVPVRVDPGQLRTALLNVVLNARDATEAGGTVQLFVEARPALEVGAGEAVLGIVDSGVGMSPAVVARAVEPFFTTKPVGTGSGLGLSMTYGFMRQSDGRLELTSEPGRGTTVRLVFPLLHGPSRPPMG